MAAARSLRGAQRRPCRAPDADDHRDRCRMQDWRLPGSRSHRRHRGPGHLHGRARAALLRRAGWRWRSGKPVVGTTSLAVMAHRADALARAQRAGRLLAVAVDARRDMIYFQLFADAQRSGACRLAARAGARLPRVIGAAAGDRRRLGRSSGRGASRPPAAHAEVALAGSAAARRVAGAAWPPIFVPVEPRRAALPATARCQAAG